MVDLEKLKEVGEKATKGPWSCDGIELYHSDTDTRHPVIAIERDCGEGSFAFNEKDIKFFVEARNNWDAMIKEIETLREAKKEAKSIMSWMDLDNENYRLFKSWLEKHGSEDE